jgi:formylglycine-generating enzyme required for sulfatase activity
LSSKFALVIANTEYEDASFAKLTAPGKDAEEFAQVLQEAELAAFDNVQILLNEGESKIRRSIARFFVNRQRDDLLLLYFSGHGVRNEQGQLFLAANDTEISILDATGIPADFITHSMNNSRSQRQLLILDCCNSGAFAYGSKSASAIGKSMGIATAFEGSGFGRVVLTATDATQFAWEGDKVIGDTQKSVFTHFLIEGLKGEADRDGDGRIHVDELYDYAYEQVVRRTPKQTPGKWSYKQQGDIVLRENLKPHDVKPAPLPSDLLELLSYPNFSARKAGIQELIILLDGKHLGMARAAEDKLREIAENDVSLDLRKTASDILIAHGLLIEKPGPIPIEIPDEGHGGEKKIETPTRKVSRSAGDTKQRAHKVAAVKEKTLYSLPNFKTVITKLNGRLIGGIAGGLLMIGLLVWGGSRLLQNLPAETAESTRTFEARAMLVSQPSATFTSQISKTNTPAPTRTEFPLTQTAIPLTPEPGNTSTMISEKDGMTLLYVPAGPFQMGSNLGGEEEKPVHQVTLDAFWIDKTEVTNSMFAKCVQDGDCNPPRQVRSHNRADYYGNSEFEDYPVIYVSWNDAMSYCSWVGRRLPTEAEWEKAARGDDARDFPWGNTRPNSNLLNYNGTSSAWYSPNTSGRGHGDTTKVGSYLDGVSPYGALDMAGNVSEWIADWYRSSYYANSPAANPQGPEQGSARVIRGGSWDSGYREFDCFTDACSTYISVQGLFTWARLWDSSDVANHYYGFRCAMDTSP